MSEKYLGQARQRRAMKTAFFRELRQGNNTIDQAIKSAGITRAQLVRWLGARSFRIRLQRVTENLETLRHLESDVMGMVASQQISQNLSGKEGAKKTRAQQLAVRSGPRKPSRRGCSPGRGPSLDPNDLSALQIDGVKRLDAAFRAQLRTNGGHDAAR